MSHTSAKGNFKPKRKRIFLTCPTCGTRFSLNPSEYKRIAKQGRAGLAARVNVAKNTGKSKRCLMNKTKIEWCDYTWNPITGCLHGCSYCYARKTAENPFYRRAFPYKFEPHLYPERLKEPSKMKKPQTIFVCSMADLFGEWVPDDWISKIMTSCNMAQWHTYIFLTKNPTRFFKISGNYLKKDNFWFGTTETGEIYGDPNLNIIKRLPAKNTFVSFEPLLHEIDVGNLLGIKQVIIGAQTNPPIDVTPEMTESIIRESWKAGKIPVFVKSSIKWANTKELAWPVNKCQT